ncbi:MAG: HAD family hydrolase [Candidatus Helarchaeota archaeon]
MIKLLALDLDGTLAEFNTPIPPGTITLLKKIQDEGVTLAVTSGKDIGHLSGLIRQSGLEDIILVGDNGGVIHFTHHYPPVKTLTLEMTSAADKELKRTKKAFQDQFGQKIWVQPNQTTFSLFGTTIDIEQIYSFCDTFFKTENIKHLKCFKTSGALDIVPLNIDKGSALKLIQHELKIQLEDTAVIGDGSNDLPMFFQAKLRITFPKSAELFKHLAPKIVKDIDAALQFLLELIEFDKSSILLDLTGA